MNTKIKKLLNNEGKNYILPFFWQHGEDEETLRRYMQIIHESNIGAVCVESRPHPDFCGPKWWRDMDVILEEAKKREMKVWILDDSHFPTGFANGAMAGQPDELCRQSLTCRTYALTGGESLHLAEEELLHPAPYEKNLAEQYIMNAPERVFSDDRLFGIFAKNADRAEILDLKEYRRENTLSWQAPAGSWTVYVLHLTRNYGYHRSYINMMDRRSCQVLIDAVYEPHYVRYKEEFGKTIAGFFSDEPELGNGHLYDTNDPYGSPGMDYPWSAELEVLLRQQLGEELEQRMTLLWDSAADPEETARLRYLFMDAVTELVRKDFSEQIGDWCHEHGVEYIGHLIEDDNHHTRTGSSLGHYFRGLSGQDLAGIDDIGGQVFPQGEDISYYYNVFAHRNGEFYHYLLGKLADSAAAIDERKAGRTMCEIFGNYGWEAGVRLEKYLVDHFLVRGINHFVPHAFSPKAYPDPDCPPHFYAGGNNPQYRHFGALMAYTNRVCELMNDGRHVSPAAVLYHAEADWTGEHMTTDQVCHPLLDAQIDMDVLPQDVFSQRDKYHTQIRSGLFRVHTQEYRILLIPGCEFITEALAQGIRELTEAGIPVYYVGQVPRGLCSGSGNVPEVSCVRPEELTDLLKKNQIPDIVLAPSNDRIRYRRYIHKDGTEIYLFVNEGNDVWEGRVSFTDPAKGTAYLYDAWENAIDPVDFTDRQLDIRVEPLHSRILVLDAAASSEEVQMAVWNVNSRWLPGAKRERLPLEGPWMRSTCRSIDYPGFGEAQAVSLPDRLAEEQPKFSGFVRYQNHFISDGSAPVYLRISDAHEGVEVFLNGKSLGIQIAPPFRYLLNDGLERGDNELTVEVATTLERENSGIPDVTGQIKEPTALSGITGEISLYQILS